MVIYMQIFTVLFRTIFFYFFVLISYRIMGKREIGQLGVIDLIVSILIAELVAISIEEFKQDSLKEQDIFKFMTSIIVSNFQLNDCKKLLDKLQKSL